MGVRVGFCGGDLGEGGVLRFEPSRGGGGGGGGGVVVAWFGSFGWACDVGGELAELGLGHSVGSVVWQGRAPVSVKLHGGAMGDGIFFFLASPFVRLAMWGLSEKHLRFVIQRPYSFLQ